MSNNFYTDKHFRQLILLDKDFRLVASDDIIFSSEKLKNISVGKWFPFIESICDTLKDITISDGEILFSRVESPALFLPGSYDFSFMKIEIEGKDYIQWSIYDYTKVYTYLTKYQQLKNEKDIYRQKLEYQSKKVKSIDELF